MKTYFDEISNYNYRMRREIINAITELVKAYAKNGKFKIAETEQPYARFDLDNWTSEFNIREYTVTTVRLSNGLCELVVRNNDYGYDDEDDDEEERTFELGETFDLISLAELHDAIVRTIEER